MTPPAKLRQHVRYVNSADGTRIVWAESGTGPLVVKAANWLTHLEYESGDAAGESLFAALSAREHQVLALMADGLSNTDIAERLNISEKTVRNHTSNLFDKLGVWSRAQAIVFARDHGFSG